MRKGASTQLPPWTLGFRKKSEKKIRRIWGKGSREFWSIYHKEDRGNRRWPPCWGPFFVLKINRFEAFHMVGISLVTLVLSRLCLSFCLACASSFGEVWHAWWSLLQGFYCQIRCKRLFFGVLFFLIGLCLCVCVPALRVCCSLCLVIVAGIVWGLVCPHICCAWIGWDWGRCCFGVCVVCVGCLSQVIFCVFVKSVVFTRKQSSP